MKPRLGTEIRRLRLETGDTLRLFARKVGISPPHQSDIELGRRLPSPDVLRAMAKHLAKVGGTYEYLSSLDARLESDLQAYVQDNPEVRQMLRRMRESGRPATEILRELERTLSEPPEEGDTE
jgi:transcriptional regulator with XRE-family HTH domain